MIIRISLAAPPLSLNSCLGLWLSTVWAVPTSPEVKHKSVYSVHRTVTYHPSTALSCPVMQTQIARKMWETDTVHKREASQIQCSFLRVLSIIEITPRMLHYHCEQIIIIEVAFNWERGRERSWNKRTIRLLSPSSAPSLCWHDKVLVLS